MGKDEPRRYWELDAARGVALLMMLVSNFVSACVVFGLIQTQLYDVWWWLAKITAVGFVFIAGISVTLSAVGLHVEGKTRRAKAWPNIKRGAWIFAWGLVITLVTYVALGETYIRWGVLHLIGFAIVASIPLVGRKWLSLCVGLSLSAWGYAISAVRVDSTWWVWLGYRYTGFRTEDYFPVAPWLGVFLIGVFAGHVLYPAGKRLIPVTPTANWPVRVLCWLGLHTLVIYLLHQPMFVVAFVLSGAVPLVWFGI